MSAPLFNEEFLQKIELLHVISKKVFAGSPQATRRAKRLGSGIEVRDFRPYVAGDDLRHIDWNYYAATRDLLLRLFEEEEDLHIYFLVDVSASMSIGGGEKLRYAKRVAGALAYIGLANLDRVSVVPFGSTPLGQLPPSRGRGQIWKVFSFLEQEWSDERTDIGAALKRFAAQTKRPGLAVILSDFYDHAGIDAGVNALRYQRFEPLLFQVWDEAEANPALNGDLELVDCETKEGVRVTVTSRMLDDYRQAHARHMDRVASFAASKALLHFRAPIQLPFDELVLQVFRAGGFLR
ncbi:MAG: hypothetical protein ACI81R_002405 [Bradymonadia bacterium]|jgi:uncharacterized protein (DUF58 family)